jgi:hypothetical protein
MQREAEKQRIIEGIKPDGESAPESPRRIKQRGHQYISRQLLKKGGLK